jgi:hypothetical protein
MKNFALILILALTSVNMIAQEKKNYTFFGITNANIPVRSSIDGSHDSYLDNKTVVLVSAALEDRYNDSYEIFYNKKKLYISREYLNIQGITFDDLIKLEQNEKDSVAYYAQFASTLLYEADFRDLLSFLDKTKSAGLAILNWSYSDESEYTSGTSTKIEVYNPTKKTIKYLWFSFVAYNAVDDKIIQKGSSIVTRKGIGPIKPGDSGSYSYPYVWFTDLVESAKISSIKIQYMDGTIKTILNPRSVTVSKKLSALLTDNSIDN